MSVGDLAPLIVAVPLVGAVVVRLLPLRADRRVGDAVAVLAAAVTAVLGLVLLAETSERTLVHWVAGWAPVGGTAVGIPLVADPLSAGISALAAVVATAVLTSKFNSEETVDDRSHGLALIFVAGLSGFALAGDLLTLFVFLEMTSITAYALTGYHPETRGALQGAVGFAITNTIGALLFLAGAALLYVQAGTPNLAEVAEVMSGREPDGATVVAMTFMVTGLFVKGAVVPFHFWHADAHTVAPSWAGALFAAVLVQVPLYTLARLTWTALAGPVASATAGMRGVFLVFALTTAVVGAVMCLLQDDLKRALSFSTVSHMGIATAGFALLEAHGLAGTALYVVGHALVKAGLFLVAGALVARLGTASISALSASPDRMPFVAALLAVSGLALVGAPPFGMYTGKVLIEGSSQAVGYTWVPYVLLGAAALTGAAVLRAAALLALPGRPDRVVPYPGEHDTTPPEEVSLGRSRGARLLLAPAVVLVAAAAMSGPLPTMAAEAQEGAERLIETGHYVDAVLRGERAAGATSEPKEVFTATSLAESGVASLVAVGIAVAGLRRIRWEKAPALAGAVVAFRRVHTGHVGDYVTWLITGTVVLGIAMSVVLR